MSMPSYSLAATEEQKTTVIDGVGRAAWIGQEVSNSEARDGGMVYSDIGPE